MSEKKRKRVTEGDERLSKKAASEGSTSMQTVKFSVLSDGRDWAPAIGSISLIVSLKNNG